MNKQRSAKVTRALERIAKAVAEMQSAVEDIRGVGDDISESLDNMSDGARQGDNGQAMEMDLGNLTDIVEAIDGFDIKKTIDDAARDLDLNAPEMPEATLSEEELAARREARLPNWARIRIDNAEKAAASALETAEKAFSEPTGEPKEFLAWRHFGAFKGKRLPTDIIEAPFAGLTLKMQQVPGEDEETWGLEIAAERSINVRPISSNMVFVCGRKW